MAQIRTTTTAIVLSFELAPHALFALRAYTVRIFYIRIFFVRPVSSMSAKRDRDVTFSHK